MRRSPLVVPFVALAVAACRSEPKPDSGADKPAERVVSPEKKEKKKPDEEKAPAPPPKAPAGVTDADLAKAKAAYARGDLEAVPQALSALPAVERDGAPPVEREARLLVRRSRLLREILSTVAKSPLADGVGIEDVQFISTGHLIGRVVPGKGDNVRVVGFGVEVEKAEDDVVSRRKLTREEYVEAARARLADQASRVKPDDADPSGDALGHFRCAYYAWTYGLSSDAMPHLDKVLASDGFPIVVYVFSRKRSSALVGEWCAVTGHAPPRVAPPPEKESPAAEKPPSPTPAPTPAPTPSPDPGSSPDKPSTDPSPQASATPGGGAPDAAGLKKARELFQAGMAKYKASFGEAKDPDRALRDAKQLLENARDRVEQATSGRDSTDEAEDLRSEIQSLLFDVRKRSRI